MARRGCGCLPFILGGIILALWIGGGPSHLTPLEVESYDPRSPRRPLPQWENESFVIEDRDAKPADSMGTAFSVDGDGVWLTAEHVTHGCARIGLEEDGYAKAVSRVLESRESDASLIRDGIAIGALLPLSAKVPAAGSRGYHMGFPAGEPTVVASELIGTANARRGRSDVTQPVLAWAERARVPDGDGTLSGISGGPSFAEDGHVVGINSASTDRRGRILTTDPGAMMRLVAASGAVDERAVAYPFADLRDADRRFRGWLNEGMIRRVFCDVDD
jgi:S1-C subfamily serine protease